MVKNVIVVNDYDYVQGGASLVAIETANLLFESGYNVYFFCGVSNKEKSILNKEIPVISTNKYAALENPNKIVGVVQGINNSSATKEMEKLLRKMNIEETVVFIHGYTKVLSTSFIKVCKKYNIKTILTAHDYFSICANGGLFNYKKNQVCQLQGTRKCKWCNCDSRNFLIKLYRDIRFFAQNINKFRDSIDYLVTISETNEALLRDFFSKSNIVRIYNPTSITERKERILAEANDCYIYVGRVDKEKGIDFLCNAFLGGNKKLLVVGDGTELKNFREKYESENISFTGWVNHDDVLMYMCKAKALIFPSLLYEGAPLTIFEAQSMGLPVIVSKFSNGKDFVTSDTGWIYNPYDLDELKNIITSSDLIQEKSIAAYNNYWNNPFTKIRYIKEIEKLFKKIGGVL